MRFSWTSLIRLLSILLFTSGAAAIGVARIDLAPKPVGRRRESPANVAGINGFLFKGSQNIQRVLDLDRGVIHEVQSIDGELLDQVSYSPWEAQDGERHAVGRRHTGTGLGNGAVSGDFGIARFVVPGGSIIDRIDTQLIPTNAPCWYPGTEARVLFAAGDGHLYHLSFDAKRPGGLETSRRPFPIAWHCDSPRLEDVLISEPHIVKAAGLEDCVLVSQRVIETRRGSRRFSRGRLTTLAMNSTGASVESSERLIVPGEAPDHDDAEERFPAVAQSGPSRLVLAYLRGPSKRGWRLRLAELAADSSTGSPRIVPGTVRDVTDDCLPSPPVFVDHGRGVYVVVIDAKGEISAKRFDVLDSAGVLVKR